MDERYSFHKMKVRLHLLSSLNIVIWATTMHQLPNLKRREMVEVGYS